MAVLYSFPALLGGNIAVAVIHKARQRHGNAAHLVLMGRIQPVDCIQKLRLRYPAAWAQPLFVRCICSSMTEYLISVPLSKTMIFIL